MAAPHKLFLHIWLGAATHLKMHRLQFRKFTDNIVVIVAFSGDEDGAPLEIMQVEGPPEILAWRRKSVHVPQITSASVRDHLEITEIPQLPCFLLRLTEGSARNSVRHGRWLSAAPLTHSPSHPARGYCK